jgi:nicotinamidase/pyrazinamidase
MAGGTGEQSVNQIAVRETDVLLVVDVQNDFCPDGALAVPHGEEVVPVVNDLAHRFRNVVLIGPH